MSTAKTKKLMRRRQKGSLQRRNARRDLNPGSRRSQLTRSASQGTIALPDSALNSTPDASTSRRLPAPPALSRSLSRRDRPASQPAPQADSRRPRANALTRSAASRDLNSTLAKRAIPSRSSKRDVATGRILFPVDYRGKIQYMPIASEATPQELKLGLFVAKDSIQKPPVNSLLDLTTEKRPAVQDFNTKRTLFATLNAQGKREYLPKEDEATALELSQGRYVPDDQVEVPSSDRPLLDLPPRFDLTEQRKLFATRSEAGNVEYLPQKSNATAWELSRGHYIDDDAI